MESIKNTRKDWMELIDRYQTNPEYDEKEIPVEINTKDQRTQNIMELRYFFLLASILKKENRIDENNKLILNILLKGEDTEEKKERQAIYSRIRALLFFVNQCPWVDIKGQGYTNKTEKLSDWDSSRVFPLCVVGNNSADTWIPDYQELKVCTYDRKQKSNRGEGSYTILANRILNKIQDKEIYIGYNNFKLNEEKKIEIRDKVCQWIQKWAPEMDILSEIIWLYFIKELIDEKKLFGQSVQDKKEVLIYENIMEKSRMDAIDYAEGLYQLIENSCLHSEGKQAWFGFKMYHAGRNVSMSRLMNEVSQRESLYKKYKFCFTEPGERMNSDNIFNEEYQSFFEFFVMDMAETQRGMVDTYNDVHQQNKIEKIEDIFSIEPRQDLPELYMEDMTVHYGLRLLKTITEINRGYMFGYSPIREGKTQYYYISSNTCTEKEEKTYLTEWNIILPISTKWKKRENNGVTNISSSGWYGKSVEAPRKKMKYISSEQLFSDLDALDAHVEKYEIIKLLHEKIKRIFVEGDSDPNYISKTLLILDCSKYRNNEGIRWIEIFAKALFSSFIWIKNENRNLEPRIAIILSGQDYIYEFTRLYAIFCMRDCWNVMENVQLALCDRLQEDGQEYNPRVVIAGNKFENILDSVRMYSYAHLENSLQYLSLLSNLSALSKKDEQENRKESLAIYPFNLYLPSELPKKDEERECSIWQDSWFISRIQNVLDTNLQSKEYGCKVKDIHIRLGSKIHFLKLSYCFTTQSIFRVLLI